MQDLIIKGKISFTESPTDFLNAFNQLLKKYNTQFKGNISIVDFEECELVEDE